MIDRLSLPIRQGIERMNRVLFLVVAITVATVPLMLISQTATANQVTNRSVLISSAQAAQTGVTYTFGFAPNQSPTTAIQSLKFQACTAALGACTAPHGLSFTSAVASTIVGWTNNASPFTANAGSNNCTASASIICATRTQAAVETGTTARTVLFTTITNQDVNAGNCGGAINCTFFVRMTDFSDTAYLTALDTGTVASSTTQLFTVNAAIQEVLSFCVGATTINDVTTAPPACASISGTSLNLGTLDSGHINVSPVTVVNGDSNNGIAELSTNASNGSTVAYDSIQQSGTFHLGTLRVAGATCITGGGVFTDQCINAIGTTKAAIVTGTEAYGMTIAGVNCAATTAYTCTFAGGTYNLIRAANYNCQGSNTYISTEHDQLTGTSGCSYAWDETGTTQTIASSTSPFGPVDKEALILKFAATPNIVTPTGSYTAKADFVATPTF
jgi:hypothetical protein